VTHTENEKDLVLHSYNNGFKTVYLVHDTNPLQELVPSFPDIKPQLEHGIYKHYKNKLYQVYGCAWNLQDKEYVVVYQSLYDDYKMWIRPYDMFVGHLEDNITKRFTLTTSVSVNFMRED
jgi:hypothetical protein